MGRRRPRGARRAGQPAAGAQPTAASQQPGTARHRRPHDRVELRAAGPEPTIHERLEGQRAWLAQLDRRSASAPTPARPPRHRAGRRGRRARLRAPARRGGGDHRRRRPRCAGRSGASRTASQAAQEDVQSLSERLAALETEVSGLQRRPGLDDQRDLGDPGRHPGPARPDRRPRPGLRRLLGDVADRDTKT